MPFTIGTAVDNLPSDMDVRFATTPATLEATGGGTEDTFSLTRNSQGNSAIAAAGTWVVAATYNVTNAVAQSSDPTTWVGGGLIVNNDLVFTNTGNANIGTINTITIAGSNGDIVLTVTNGGAHGSSDFGFEITAATGNALSSTEYPGSFSAGSALDITFEVVGEAVQPTLADEKELLFIESANANTQNFIQVAADTTVTISGNFPDAPGDAFVEYGDKGNDANMGADSSIRIFDNSANFSSTNRTFRLAGGFDLNRANIFELRGSTILHCTNTVRNCYIRSRRTGNNYSDDGGIDDLILDGDVQGWGIYWLGSMLDVHQPRSLTLRRGFVVGHAGSFSASSAPGYYLVPNVDGTSNRNTHPEANTLKYDIAMSNTTTNDPAQPDNPSAWTDAERVTLRNNARFFEARNSADGLSLGILPRTGINEAGGYGSGNITSEFTYRVLDEDGAAIPAATIYIPSATGGNINDVVTFDALTSSTYTTAIPANVRFVNDATMTATTDANGYGTAASFLSPDQTGSANPVLIGHIGYAQINTTITIAQKLANPGNFARLGDTPTATVVAYGYHPLQSTVDLRGLNVKDYSSVLALDEALTSPTEAAANAIMTYAIATRTATAITASTIDNLHDALYVSRLVTGRSGNIARTWSVAGQTINTDGSLTIAGQALSVGSTFTTITEGDTVGTLTLPASNTINFSVDYGTITWTTTAPTNLISNGRITGNITGLPNNSTYSITGGDITNLTIATSSTGISMDIDASVTGRNAFITANPHVTINVNYTIVNTRTAGLQSVYRNGVLETLANPNLIPAILPNQTIDVVYSETGRSDFLQRVSGSAFPAPTTITVNNAPTPFPTSSPAAGLLATQAPADFTFTDGPLAGQTLTVMQISITEAAVSETEVNTALQEQVKGTANYNALIQMLQEVDIIQSDGASSTGAMNGDSVLFVAGIPVICGYVRPTGTDQSSQALAGPTIAGSFTPDGSSTSTEITIGVVMSNIAAFDPAVTGGQINDAITDINGHTTAEVMTVDSKVDDILQDTDEMRSNRLLGLKPQAAQT